MLVGKCNRNENLHEEEASTRGRINGGYDKFVKLSPLIKMNGSKSLKTPFGVSGTLTGVLF